MNIITYDEVKSRIITIQNQNVILDNEVALLYNVETRAINQAVSRNRNKFPKGYILELTDNEWQEVKSQFVISPLGGGRAYKPKAFTEKGLYMLATILKSPKAVQTTIAIIDAFAQLRELTQKVYQLSNAKTESQQISILENSVDLIVDFIDNELITSQKETEVKIKLPFLEFTRKITKVKK